MSIAIKEITVSLAQEKLPAYADELNRLTALAWQVVLINAQGDEANDKLLCHIHLMLMN